MARITLELTEEQVKIVRCLRFKKIDINRSGKDILRTVNELDRIAESIGDEESEPRVALLQRKSGLSVISIMALTPLICSVG